MEVFTILYGLQAQKWNLYVSGGHVWSQVSVIHVGLPLTWDILILPYFQNMTNCSVPPTKRKQISHKVCETLSNFQAR